MPIAPHVLPTPPNTVQEKGVCEGLGGCSASHLPSWSPVASRGLSLQLKNRELRVWAYGNAQVPLKAALSFQIVNVPEWFIFRTFSRCLESVKRSRVVKINSIKIHFVSQLCKSTVI